MFLWRFSVDRNLPVAAAKAIGLHLGPMAFLASCRASFKAAFKSLRSYADRALAFIALSCLVGREHLTLHEKRRHQEPFKAGTPSPAQSHPQTLHFVERNDLASNLSSQLMLPLNLLSLGDTL